MLITNVNVFVSHIKTNLPKTKIDAKVEFESNKH